MSDQEQDQVQVQDANIQDAIIATEVVIINNQPHSHPDPDPNANPDDIEVPIITGSITNANVIPILNARVLYHPSYIIARINTCNSFDVIFIGLIFILFASFFLFIIFSFIPRKV